MIAVGHSAVGAIIGTAAIKFINPNIPFAAQVAVVFIFALSVHYAMDFIPHGHYRIDYRHLNRSDLSKFFLDLVGGVLLFAGLALIKFGLTSYQFWLIIAAIAASQLTDAFEALVSLEIIPRWSWVTAHSRFHSRMHWHDEPTSPLPGGARPLRWTDVWQLTAVILAIMLILS